MRFSPALLPMVLIATIGAAQLVLGQAPPAPPSPAELPEPPAVSAPPAKATPSAKPPLPPLPPGAAPAAAATPKPAPTPAKPAPKPTEYYTVEDIALPTDVVGECGGLAVLPSSKVVALFHQGEVYTYTPETKTWQMFAEGLHDPLGVLAISETEVLVAQRPELTRLVDENGDGRADRYECVSDAWGLSGNYHEFISGPVRDAEGNLYVALGNGSNASVARYEVRGEFKPTGYTKTAHFSAVPYRGWVVKIAPDGSLSPVASGFRQPNGLGRDAEGRLWVTDNQGDWVGTSKLFQVQAGKFYGHASSLVWQPGITKLPPPAQLDRMRTEGAVLFPHAVMANSPGQPAWDTSGGKFGPYDGQMFVPEFNIPRLMRVMLDEVAGTVQGAVTPFFDGPPLHSGTHRAAFAPDGSLWVAQSERKGGWPGGTGLQRISWKGKLPMDVAGMRMTETGFELQFTKPLLPGAAAQAQEWKVRRYYYQYHEIYGSPQTDVHEVKLAQVQVARDRTRLKFDVDTLLPGYVYEFTLRGVQAADGTHILNPLVCYTVNRLRDGTVAPIPRPAPEGQTVGSGKDKPSLE